MKRRLNILCLLVMLVFGYSVFESAYYISNAFVAGFEAGMDARQDMEKVRQLNNLRSVSLVPDNFKILEDSVYNEKSKTYIPASYEKLVIAVDAPINIWLKFLSMLCRFLGLVIIPFSVVVFIKLIIAINKSDIFSWKNVRRLRWLGALLIFSFLCDAIPAYISVYELSGVFSIADYSIDWSSLVSKLTLVLGFVSLIVGELFAIGLKMKEEQELTI